MHTEEIMIALLWHNILNRCLDCWRWYRSDELHVTLRKINRNSENQL